MITVQHKFPNGPNRYSAGLNWIIESQNFDAFLQLLVSTQSHPHGRLGSNEEGDLPLRANFLTGRSHLLSVYSSSRKLKSTGAPEL